MNQRNANFSDVDAVLDQLSQVAVSADVERRLEARLQEFCQDPQSLWCGRLGCTAAGETPAPQMMTPARVMPPPQRRLPRPLVQASLAAGLAALVVATVFLTFGKQDAWAQVAEAIRSKPWARWTMQIPKDMPVPEGLQVPEVWFSAEKKVYAQRAMQSARYIDLARQETYDYMPQTKTLFRSLTSDTDNVEVGHYETLLRIIAEGDRALKVSESPIQIVERTRRDAPGGDRRWTEYSFACRDPRRTPPDYQVTFRVDPKTRLPVEMRSTEKFSANDPADERIYALDYPQTGPGDIYALGVPRDAKFVDRRRAKVETAKEIKEFLAAYVQAREQPIEPYSATVLKSDPRMDFADIYTALRVSGDGDELRVDEVDNEQLMEFRKQLWAKKVPRPVAADRLAWWRQKTAGMTFKAIPRGGEFLPHRIGYPPELLTLGASPVDNPDCRVTLDRQPVSGPEGTVLLKIRTETTVGFNDCLFWIAPERDHLVLRHEIHFSKDHAAWNNSTQIIDEVKQSPAGRWYATAVRVGRIEKPGADLPSDPVLVKPNQPPAAPAGTLGPVTTSTYRYLVDFK